ncbi:putative anti-sigma factor [Pedobacter sp. BAL39]|uniref:FecR family protein n=1 Tax=Pedobacter sp. BAL39 TaxID=391596 RepID=UPI0001559909|nr:FecR domain-containing protein [Pedobacter sp. BAL39]EDM36953.1 putative anti-sigma factor [Pedobacter sp. BAL39]
MKINKEIIQRYHIGQCSPEERELVEAWLMNDDVEWSYPEHVSLDHLENKGWEKLSGRFKFQQQSTAPLAEQTNTPVVSTFDTKRKKWSTSLGIAASLLLIAAAGYFFLNFQRYKNSPAVQYRQVAAKNGEKVTLKLPDGTLVHLNSGSTVRFPNRFPDTARMIDFSGEAFFDVAKDPSKPFYISTRNTSIKVLGTHFNLRCYPSEIFTAVVVAEGKVRFMGPKGHAHLILTANQMGLFSTPPVHDATSTGNMVKTNVYANKYTSWKEDQLILDNMTVEEILPVLERWYNVEVEIKNNRLIKERYTGSFLKPALTDVLESISFALKCHYKKNHQGSFIIY